MNKKRLPSLATALVLFASVITAAAAPTISVDMDPTTTGIQSTLTISPGAIFTVDVVIADAVSPTIFDTVILETSFNNAGGILGPGPTGPLAGALAGTVGTLDVFGPLTPTSPSTGLAFGLSIPAAGFASATGAVGLLNSPAFPPGINFTVGAPVSIYSIDFTALIVGTSNILAAGTPPGSPELVLSGTPVVLAGPPVVGTVNVVPEPGTWMLLSSGLAGLAGLGWRRRNHTA